MIYLDNATTAWPKPEIVYQTMDSFLRKKGGNPGHGSHSLAEAARHMVDETRMLTARFINAAEIERVIFTMNCTDSINMGLKGLLNHASNVNGCIQPIEEYGLIARRHNLIFMVDAAQSAGHVPIDVQVANIDLLAFSAHKGTLGPPGIGVLYVGPREG